MDIKQQQIVKKLFE